VDAGVDAIVAQGSEAGGHGGSRATLPFVPAVVDIAKEIPVVAAGGIADGRGVAAALALGASGVLCGTGFFASEESLASDNAKQSALRADGEDTERSSVFDVARGLDWPTGWDIRAMRNSFTQTWSRDIDGLKQNIAAEQARFDVAIAADDSDIAPVIVGEAVGFIRAVEPAQDTLHGMISQAEDCLQRLGGLVDTSGTGKP
jgi:nitronate monooxygenase